MGKSPILHIGDSLPEALSAVKAANASEPPKGSALTALKAKGTLLLWSMMNFFEMRSYYGKIYTSLKRRFHCFNLSS